MPHNARPESLRKQIVQELFEAPRADVWARIFMSAPFWILAIIPALGVFGLTLLTKSPLCRPELTLQAYHWACVGLSFISAWAFQSSLRIALDFAASPELARRAADRQGEQDSMNLRSHLEEQIDPPKNNGRSRPRL